MQDGVWKTDWRMNRDDRRLAARNLASPHLRDRRHWYRWLCDHNDEVTAAPTVERRARYAPAGPDVEHQDDDDDDDDGSDLAIETVVVHDDPPRDPCLVDVDHGPHGPPAAVTAATR